MAILNPKQSRFIIAFLAILFLTIILYRIIDFGRILFPYENIPPLVWGDIPSYLPQLFFLDTCGYYQKCPYWYNGFTTFTGTQPAWYFFTYPLYLLLQSFEGAFYASIIINYILAFLIFFSIGKLFRISRFYLLAFYAFFYGSVTATLILSMGRAHELFAWTSFFIATSLIYYYKEHFIDRRFLLIALFFTITILSYHSLGILLTGILGGLFLVKSWKERKIILLVLFITFLLTSFWWLPLFFYPNSLLSFYTEGAVETLFTIKSFRHYTSLAILIFPFLLLSTFLLSLRGRNNHRQEILFHFPIFLIAIVLLTGVVKYLPVIRNIFTNIYLLFLWFFILLLFFRTNPACYPPRARPIILLAFITLLIATLITALIRVPLYYTPSSFDKELNTLAPNIEGPFLIVGKLPPPTHKRTYYSQWIIHYNLTTPDGVYPTLKERSYSDDLEKVYHAVTSGDCATLLPSAQKLHVTSFIVPSPYCAILQQCGLKEKARTKSACLFIYNP